MSRMPGWVRWVRVSLAIVSVIIAIVLLPITENIAVGGNIILWALVGILALPQVIQTGISTYRQLSTVGSSSHANNELDDITNKVNIAANIANNDPMLMGYSNRFQLLKNWKQYAETLAKTYNDYKKRRDRASKHATIQTVQLLEKLIKLTKRSFIFLSRKDDFVQIANLAYNIAFAQKRWQDAADLAYEVGRIYHELGRHTESNDWIEPLRTCLKNAHFNGYWVRVYNGLESDSAGTLDEPSETEAKKLFHEALTYAAKLYDMEGLNKQDDTEAQKYFKKAMTRADKVPDKILYSWIVIHIAEMAPRLNLKPELHYKDVLAPLNNLKLETLDSPKRSDVVNLMLTCYYQLGRLDGSDQNNGPNTGVNWYQQQLELAEKYGLSAFQVLAHERLAYISLREGLTHTSSSDQSKNFQVAYEHTKKAWVLNKAFSDEGPGVIETNELAQLMISIMDELIKISHANSYS